MCRARQPRIEAPRIEEVKAINDVDIIRLGDVSSGLHFPGSFSFGGMDEQRSGPILAAYTSEASQSPASAPVTELGTASSGIQTTVNAGRFEGQFARDSRRYSVGTDLYSARI